MTPDRSGTLGAEMETPRGVQLFRRPAAPNAPGTYWFWHRRPTAAEVRRQVAEIASGGYRTFLIQARLSYPIGEYLDDGFLRAYKTAVEEARRLNLEVGIYDDYNWMSGHAGGRTVQARDSLRERHLFWTSSPLQAGSTECSVTRIRPLGGMGEAITAWHFEGGKCEWTDWDIVAALAYPSGHISAVSDIIDLTANATVSWSRPDGCTVRIGGDTARLDGHTATVFVTARSGTSRMINYLLPEAAERFTQVGYDPFYREMSEHFGGTIKYMFVDHPGAGYYTWDEHEGSVGNSLLFAGTLRDHYERVHGRGFDLALLSLIRATGPSTTRRRAQFFETYTALACESFFGTIGRWAEKHNVGLAGHEMLAHVGQWGLAGAYGPIDTRTNFGADYFAIDAFRTRTTVDAANFVPQISARIGDSVARANGRSGCMVEQYATSKVPGAPVAAGQWELTLQEMRAQAIRHHLFGARQFIFHGFYQTDGDADTITPFSNARFDFAPGINFEPWYVAHEDFAAESSRLSAFIDAAAPACDLAVVYPRLTTWVGGPNQPFADHSAFWFRHLSERGYNFHLIDERQLAAARIESGRLHLGKRVYATVVMPGVTTVHGLATLDLLHEFVTTGGRLIMSGPLPNSAKEMDADRQIQDGFARIVGSAQSAIHLAAVPSPEDADRALRGSLAHRPVASADDETEPWWQWAGRDESGWRFALFNDNLRPRRITIDTAWPSLIAERWNCATGTSTRWPWVASTGASSRTFIDLDPMELACLRISPSEEPLRRLTLSSSSAHVMPTSGADDGLELGIRLVSDEPVNLHTVGEKPHHLPPTVHASTSASPIGWHVQLTPPHFPQPMMIDSGWTLTPADGHGSRPISVTQGWELQGLPTYTGGATYECQLEMPPGSTDWEWELELPEVHTVAEVTVNRRELGRRGWSPYRFTMPTDIVQSGRLSVSIRVLSTAANTYYAGTPYQGSTLDPCGLTAPPRLQPRLSVTIRRSSEPTKTDADDAEEDEKDRAVT